MNKLILIKIYLSVLVFISIPISSFSQEEGRLIHSLNGEDWELVSAAPGQGERGKYYIKYPELQVIPAKVPGDINWDMMRAGKIPDIFIGTNSTLTYGLPLKEWWYRKTFTESDDWENKKIKLNFAAVDYAAKIWLNGQFLGNHEGQFTPFSFDVTDDMKIGEKNTVIVLIESAPKNVIDKLFVKRGGWNRQFAMDEVSLTLKYWKCRTMTGWDWGTQLWSMGIWQDVNLVASTDVCLEKLLIYPDSKPPYKNARINFKIDMEPFAGKREILLEYKAICLTSKAPEANSGTIIQLSSGRNQYDFSLDIDDPALWWPNRYGDQNLYRLTVTAKDKINGQILDQVTSNFGIRELKFLQNPDAENYRKASYIIQKRENILREDSTKNLGYPDGWVIDVPKDDLPGFLVQINGRKIFLHGGNWLPADLLYGRPEKKEYEHLVRMAALANYNAFRIWGGGIIEKPVFYDLCDKYGILVWQEMPHAGRRPLETPEILANTAKELRQVLPLLINHPCIFRYGFGNELYLDRANSKQQAQFEDICKEMDPDRQALGPDPVTRYQRHAPHSIYIPREYPVFNTGYPLSIGPDNPMEWTEYGTAGASSEETLKRIMPGGVSWPIINASGMLPEGKAMVRMADERKLELTKNMKNEFYQGYEVVQDAYADYYLGGKDSLWSWHNAINGYGETLWLMSDAYRALFGEMPDLQTEIRASQFIQSEGYRYANQSHRRAQWHRSGCFMWTFNEPWPNAAHGCIVEYYGQPKMAFYFTRNSYSQVEVSTVYNSIALHPSDTLVLPVFVTNATTGDLKRCILKSCIVDLNGIEYYTGKKEIQINALTSRKIDSLSFIIPDKLNHRVLLVRFDLFDRGKKLLSSETYTFGVIDPPKAGIDLEYLRPMLKAPEAKVNLTLAGPVSIEWGGENMDIYRAALTNTSMIPALYVRITSNYKPDEVYFKDNYLILLPGEKRNVDIMVAAAIKNSFKPKDITFDAWNIHNKINRP